MQHQYQTADKFDQTKTRLRYTVHEAAMLLGLSVEAVRKRAERGKLARERDADGTVYILLDGDQSKKGTEQTVTGRQHTDQTTPDPDQTTPDPDQTTPDPDQTNELVEAYKNQVDWLRREVERKDTIIMSLTQRVPELEPPAKNPTEWLDDEEHLREGAGLSTRPDEVRQRWHAQTTKAPRASRDVLETASPRSDRGTSSEEAQEPAQHRSWWRRFFGFE